MSFESYTEYRHDVLIKQIRFFKKGLKKKQQNYKIVLPHLIHVFLLKLSSNQRKKFHLQFFTEPARRSGLFIEYAMGIENIKCT